MKKDKFQITAAIESERAILGGLLLDNSLFPEIKKRLCDNDFTEGRHKRIFYVMGELFDKRKCFDVPMLLSEIYGLNEEELLMLAHNCVSVANINAHADIVREKSVQRQLIAIATEIRYDATEILASYFEELAVEIRHNKLCENYVKFLIVEVNKAMIDSLSTLEGEIEEIETEQ